MFPEEGAIKNVLIIGVTLVMLLAGCSAETEKADSTGPSNKQKVENSAPVIEDKYTAEDVVKAAAAANDEVTLEILNKMSGDYATLFGQLPTHQVPGGE
jgi:hypothetical protein